MGQAAEINGQGIANYALEVASSMQDKPYVWGGKTTDGFDCSGFVSYVFQALFANASTSFQLNVLGYGSSSLFSDIAEQAKQPGDIIIFPAANGAVPHIGFVLDANYWIGSQSSTGVARVKFSNPYWHARPHKIRRLTMTSPQAIHRGRALCEIRDWV